MNNGTEWEDAVRKKIQYMTNYVWNGISSTDVDEFMCNFSEHEKFVGWALLDMLIYYNNEQETSIISNLVRLLERDIWLNEDMARRELISCNIKKEFDEIYKNMCFVPVDESDVSASSFSLTSQFKKSKDVSKQIKYVKVIDIPLMMAMKKEYFVFYDDIIGTGTQFDTFWKKKRFGDNMDISLKILAERNPDRHFYYLVLGGCQEGICLLEKTIPNVRIIVSEYFSNSYDIFSDDNEYWELNPEKKEVILNFIKDKEKELQFKSRYCKNLPVLFQHGRASNTSLSLYWHTKDRAWNELYKR